MKLEKWDKYKLKKLEIVTDWIRAKKVKKLVEEYIKFIQLQKITKIFKYNF